MYLGLAGCGGRRSSGVPGAVDSPCTSPGPPSISRTVSVTRTSRASASRAAALTKPRKCPSIHSRVKSFGTTSENVSSLSSPAVASPNQVAYVVSLSASRSRPETSSHRRSAVGSVVCSTLRRLLSTGRGEGEHSSVRDRGSMCPNRPTFRPKTGLFAGKYRRPHMFPHLWTVSARDPRVTTARPCVQHFRRAGDDARLVDKSR